MSLTKKERMIQPLSGKTFPSSGAMSNGQFTGIISEALRREYAGRHGAVKVVARLTGANERAVKNWFAGKNGPSGEHLVVLAQHCSHVLEAFLLLAARGDLITVTRIAEVKNQLKRISLLIDDL